MGACSGDRGDASIAGRISEGFFFLLRGKRVESGDWSGVVVRGTQLIDAFPVLTQPPGYASLPECQVVLQLLSSGFPSVFCFLWLLLLSRATC